MTRSVFSLHGPSMSRSNRLVLLAPFVLVAACDGCRGEPVGPPTIVAPEGSGSGTGASTPTADAGMERVQTNIVHEEPPTAADFAITPVEGDWTGIRGNAQRSGLRNAPAIRQPEVLWSAQVGVQGYANTPIVTADAIYVSSQGLEHNQPRGTDDPRDAVMALNPVNGQTLWEIKLDADANGMTLAGDLLIVGTDAGSVWAIDRVRGATEWQASLRCSVYQAPVVVGDELWLVRRDDMARLRLSDGEPLADYSDCTFSERGTGSADGNDVWMLPDRRAPEFWSDGRLVWQAADPGERMASWGSWQPPLLTENMFIATYHRWPFSIGEGRDRRRPAAVAFWRDNGQPAWVADINAHEFAEDETTDPTPFLRSMPWVEGGKMYWTSTTAPELVRFDVLTGERVDALRLPDCRRRQFASIVGVPGTGYLARHDGVLYGFTTEPFAVSWTLHLGLHGMSGQTNTHVPITAGCSETPVDGTALFSTPAIGPDGTLYVGSGDGWIYAVRDASWPDPVAAPSAGSGEGSAQ